MRQQLMQVLGSEEPEEVMTDVVRRFWTRAKPLSTISATSAPKVMNTACRTESQTPSETRQPQLAPVIDLSAWSRGLRCRAPVR